MPAYYFDIRQGNMIEEDRQGKQAPDLDAAREIAARSVVELLRAEDKTMTGAVIEIRDSRRELLATVPVDLAARQVSGKH